MLHMNRVKCTTVFACSAEPAACEGTPTCTRQRCRLCAAALGCRCRHAGGAKKTACMQKAERNGVLKPFPHVPRVCTSTLPPRQLPCKWSPVCPSPELLCDTLPLHVWLLLRCPTDRAIPPCGSAMFHAFAWILSAVYPHETGEPVAPVTKRVLRPCLAEYQGHAFASTKL